MVFIRAKVGGWAMFEVLTSTQMNTIDLNMLDAADLGTGGAYAPTGDLDIQGEKLQVDGDVVLGAMLQNFRNPQVVIGDGGKLGGASVAERFFYDGISLSYPVDDGVYDTQTDQWVVVGADKAFLSMSDGLVFKLMSGGLPANPNMNAIAISAISSIAIAAGTDGNYYRNPAVGQGSTWSGAALPGTSPSVNSIEYDATTGRFVLVGVKSGPAPYLATSTDAMGTAYTDRSAALPASFAGLTLGGLATNGGVVIASATTAHTKIARSTNGGNTWADSTTSFASGIIHSLAWAPGVLGGVFLALVTTGGGAGVYSSADGDTWTFLNNTTFGFTTNIGGPKYHGIRGYRNAIVVIGDIASNAPAIAYSIDDGVSFELQRIGDSGGANSLFGDVANRMLFAGHNVEAVRFGRVGPA